MARRDWDPGDGSEMDDSRPGGRGGGGHEPRGGGDPPVPTDYRLQVSETGDAVPLVYGTARVAAHVLERWTDLFKATDASYWSPQTVYALGDLRQSQGLLYLCITAGTSGNLWSGAPTGTGTDITDGTVHWCYVKMGYRHAVALGICEGPAFAFGQVWKDKELLGNTTQIPHDANHLQTNLGTAAGGRATWAPFLGLTDTYTNLATVFVDLTSGADGDLPNLSFEMKGMFADGTHADVNPADIAIDLLTDARRGAAWPAARVDSVTTGAGAASWRTYCTAFGFVLSWAIDSQSAALDLLKELLVATNTDAVWTNRADGLGGMLKFVPLGDQALTANGVTFTPNTTPAYNLGPDDLLEPVQVQRANPSDRWNSCPVEYQSRAAWYRTLFVDDPDMTDVDVRGLRRAQTLALRFVMLPATAVMLSRIRAQRSLNVRNVYTFKLPWRFMLLEPTDLVTLTDVNAGLAATPVRITAVEEDLSGEGSFIVTAEDWPAAVSAAAQYTPQAGDGFVPSLPTAVQGLVLVPGQLAATTMTDAVSTRAGAVDNMFPNHTSEFGPPDGADLTAAEWAGRVKLVGGAYAGDWVRSPGLGASLGISYDVSASPEERYYLEARVKAASAGANKGGFVKITALDQGGASLGSNSSTSNDTASYLKKFAQLVMPAATVKVRFSLLNGTDANAQAYFDAITARRMVEPGVLATGPLGGDIPVVDANGAFAWIRDAVNASPTYGMLLTSTAPGTPQWLDVARQYKWVDGQQAGTTTFAQGAGWIDLPIATSGVNGWAAFSNNRHVRARLGFSGFVDTNNTTIQVQLLAAGAQVGQIYTIFYNTAGQHQAWDLGWDAGQASVSVLRTIKVQVQCTNNPGANFKVDTNDYVSFELEEMG